jgi:hypothetical protein
LHVEAQGRVAAPALAWAVRSGDGTASGPDTLFQRTPAPVGPFSSDDQGTSGRTTVVPPLSIPDRVWAEEEVGALVPHVPGVLAVLPPVALSAVEHGMQRFLEQLEQLGLRLAPSRDESGLWPWVVAGAAAATACEIARRQLKRPAGAPALAAGRGPRLPADHLFKG